MANPDVISATAYKPGGNLKLVFAVLEIQSNFQRTSGMTIPSCKDRNGNAFPPDPVRHFMEFPPIAANPLWVYRIHVVFKPATPLIPIDPSPEITATEDFTFSFNGGTIAPPSDRYRTFRTGH